MTHQYTPIFSGDMTGILFYLQISIVNKTNLELVLFMKTEQQGSDFISLNIRDWKYLGLRFVTKQISGLASNTDSNKIKPLVLNINKTYQHLFVLLM